MVGGPAVTDQHETLVAGRGRGVGDDLPGVDHHRYAEDLDLRVLPGRAYPARGVHDQQRPLVGAQGRGPEVLCDHQVAAGRQPGDRGRAARPPLLPAAFVRKGTRGHPRQRGRRELVGRPRPRRIVTPGLAGSGTTDLPERRQFPVHRRVPAEVRHGRDEHHPLVRARTGHDHVGDIGAADAAEPRVGPGQMCPPGGRRHDQPGETHRAGLEHRDLHPRPGGLGLVVRERRGRGENGPVGGDGRHVGGLARAETPAGHVHRDDPGALGVVVEAVEVTEAAGRAEQRERAHVGGIAMIVNTLRAEQQPGRAGERAQPSRGRAGHHPATGHAPPPRPRLFRACARIRAFLALPAFLLLLLLLSGRVDAVGCREDRGGGDRRGGRGRRRGSSGGNGHRDGRSVLHRIG